MFDAPQVGRHFRDALRPDVHRSAAARRQARSRATTGQRARSRWWTADGLFAWYRTVAYNFVLVMCDTGMRPPKAKNLRWRDIAVRIDDQGRKFVVLAVRGKDKARNLVAAANVADYLERIRAIGRATEPDDSVFTTWEASSRSVSIPVRPHIHLVERVTQVGPLQLPLPGRTDVPALGDAD